MQWLTSPHDGRRHAFDVLDRDFAEAACAHCVPTEALFTSDAELCMTCVVNVDEDSSRRWDVALKALFDQPGSVAGAGSQQP